jgi:hypothetical protein
MHMTHGTCKETKLPVAKEIQQHISKYHFLYDTVLTIPFTKKIETI